MNGQVTSEWRSLTAIAVPVVIVQVGMMLMGVVDTLMVGRLSANALAAVALGNLYFFNIIVIPMGALMALDPLVSQAVGARDSPGVTRAIQRGVILSIVLGLVATLAMLPAGPALRLFRQPAAVIPETVTYVHITAASMAPFLAFIVIRQSLQAMHRLAPIVVTIIIANVLNALLNWMLIFGRLGAPQLGVTGAAVATVIGRWMMLFLVVALAWRDLRPHLERLQRDSWAFISLRRLLAIGLPIGFQQFLEFSAFAAVGLLMGSFGALQVAAHHIALNLAALTFMVPLGVGAAAAVRVGHAIGASDPARARRAARVAYVIGAAFMTSTAIVFLTFARPLAELYTSDASVVAIAAVLIPIAGIFQVFDGSQAVGAGVLRGLGDTKVPLIAMLGGYWLIGIPVSIGLGFRSGLGPVGLWWGFVAGLAAVALFLLLRVRFMFRRTVGRLTLDEIPAL